MFADMSMLSYQRMAPEIKAICEKHGVPYIQVPHPPHMPGTHPAFMCCCTSASPCGWQPRDETEAARFVVFV